MAGQNPGSGLRVFVLLILVLCSGAYVGHRLLQDRIRERLEVALAHLPAGTEVAYGGFEVDFVSLAPLLSAHPDFRAAFQRSLTLTGLSITRGTARCEIGRIAIEGVSGEGSRADPLQVRALHLDGGKAEGGMPDCPRRLEASDLVAITGATMNDSAGETAPSGLLSWPRTGALLSAGRVEIDDIAITRRQAAMTIGRMMLETYRDGVVSSAEYDDFGLKAAKPDGSVSTSHFERLVYRDLALNDTNDVFNPSAYRDDGKPVWTGTRRLFGAIEATGFTFHGEGPGRKSTLAIASFTVSELYGHPFALPPRSTVWADREWVRSLGDWRLAQLSAEDVRLTAADASRPVALTLSVDHFAVEGYDKGLLDTVGLRGFGLSAAETGSMQIGAIDLDRIDLMPLLTASADMEEMVLAPHLAPAVTAALRTAALRVEDVSVVSATGGKIALAEAQARMSVIDGVAALQGGLQGLQLPCMLPDTAGANAAGAAGRSPLVLNALGAAFGPVLTFDTDFDIAWDRTASRLTVRRIDLDGRGLGRLHVDLDLDGRDGELFGSRAKLVRATFHWEDHSLTDRLFALFAHLQNADPASYRAAVIRQVRATPLLLTNQPDSTQQLADFLASPHDLTLTLQPPVPMGFARIAAMDQWQAVRALNAHLAHE